MLMINPALERSKEWVRFIMILCVLKSCRCMYGWQLVMAGSRFTKPSEGRYAPVEGEALAVTYALHKCRYYVMGCQDLVVATDHQPLLKIL